MSIISPDGSIVKNTPEFKFDLQPNKERQFSDKITIGNPELWSASNPKSYIVSLELWRGDELIDKTNRPIAVYSLMTAKDSLQFNGKGFELNGVTYLPSNEEYGNLETYSEMEKNIRLIKETGFNAVRFSKVVPHPYYLTLCERYGLLAFIELPINSIPEGLAQNSNFIERSKNFLSNFIRGYKKYSAVAAVGLGSGFLPELDAHTQLIERLNNDLKQNWDVISYASFADLNIAPTDSLDLYGIELLNISPKDISEKLDSLRDNVGEGKFFISSATYTVNSGNTDGYINKYSFEAQAKYFEEVINFSNPQQ